MEKVVDTQYGQTIRIGTKDDDERLYPGHLYLITTKDRSQRLVLNRSQTMHLMAELLDALRNPPMSDAS